MYRRTAVTAAPPDGSHIHPRGQTVREGESESLNIKKNRELCVLALGGAPDVKVREEINRNKVYIDSVGMSSSFNGPGWKENGRIVLEPELNHSQS